MKRLGTCLPALLALAGFASGAPAGAALIPVTNWVAHNQTQAPPTSDLNTNSPTFTNNLTPNAADGGITVMAPFSPLTLASDGDFVKVSLTLDTTGRALTGVASLNTQLRIGLFNGPAGAIVTNDIPNVGIITQYTNAVTGGLIQEQANLTQVNPFVSPTFPNIGNGTPDAGGDSIQGANPGPVYFELTLTRNAGALDITGQVSGTDSVTGNPYLATYSLLGYVPVAAGFTYNRVGFLLGGNVRGTSTLGNVTIETNVPEPASWVMGLGSMAMLGGMRRRRA